MTSKSQDVRWLPSLATAEVILIAVALINVAVKLILIHRADLELQASGFSISGNPLHTIAEPLLLFVAAVCLVGNRFWILLLSVLLCCRVLYVSSFLSWKQEANLYEVPMFSWVAFGKLLDYYLEHVDIMVELILATVILIYTFVLLRRFINARGVRVQIAGG